MRLSAFTIVVTEACNFNCTYCYQEKGGKSGAFPVVKRALDFFSPFFTDDCAINFYGGEPLLAFDLIRDTVNYLEETGRPRQTRYSLTTNGSLLTDEIIGFFHGHRFSLMLSFDGLAQEVGRQKGTFASSLETIGKILGCPGIQLETNSVFTPGTIGYLGRSIDLLLGLSVPDITFVLSSIRPWSNGALAQFQGELGQVRNSLVEVFKRTGTIPVRGFRKNPDRGVFGCFAGRDRLTLSPDGHIWGCHLFWDYFRSREQSGDYGLFSFGRLEAFIRDHEWLYPEISAHYARLHTDNYSVRGWPCFLCDDLEECRVCPMDAAFCGGDIGAIPDWMCRINGILRVEKQGFWQEISTL